MNKPNVIRSSLSLLESRDRKLLIAATFLQFIVNMADVVGVALVGVIGSLGVTYLAGTSSPNWVNSILSFIGLENSSSQETIIYVAGFAGMLFIAKSVLSLFLMKKILIFLAQRQARISIDIVEKIIRAPFHWLKRQSSDHLMYATTDGTGSIFVGVIGNLISIIVDFVLLILILGFILVINPGMALLTVFFFGSLTFLVYRLVQSYSTELGREFQQSAIAGRENLFTLLAGYREIFTLKNQIFFLEKFSHSRLSNSLSNANSMWLQYVPKATAEVGLVVGAGGLVIFQAWQNTASGGLGMILLFLASASRLTPALMRIQGSLIHMKNYAASSGATLNLISELNELELNEQLLRLLNKHEDVTPVGIKLDEVDFQFPDSSTKALSSISLEIKPGSINAFVGPSGSGKTTLADLMLGIYVPSHGQLLYRNSDSTSWQSPADIRVAYVPQNPFIFPGTLKENIAIGVKDEEIDLMLLKRAIQSSNLEEVVSRLPEGIDTDLRGIGPRISGGEKQRISLARAFYSRPNLLVIDEGTSALDASSEKAITDFLLTLTGRVTVVLIAHRLASIKGVEQIYFLESGRLKGSGTFIELQGSVPEFAKQVKLMELPQLE